MPCVRFPIVFLAALAVAGGCRQGAVPAATGDAAPGAPVAPAGSPAAPAPGRASAPSAGAAAHPEDAEVSREHAAVTATAAGRFQWTESPALEAIPDAPVAGELHGAPFPVAQVLFETGRHEWQMYFLERPLPDPTAPIEGMRFLRLDLPSDPAAGSVEQHPLAYGGALFYVDVPGEPGGFTLWTADNAWVLELTEWNVAPWDPAGPEVQVAGRAAGRVAVCYRGGGNYRNAWVAGTFAEAIVRYTREPRFERGCPSAPTGG